MLTKIFNNAFSIFLITQENITQVSKIFEQMKGQLLEQQTSLSKNLTALEDMIIEQETSLQTFATYNKT